MKLRALPYYGGKSAAHKTGPWIANLLPDPDPHQYYVETHCGMLGVLLQRRPAGTEMVNDQDGRLVTWWKVLRDDTDSLLDKLERTPAARSEFDTAKTVCDSPSAYSDLEVARAVTILLCQSIQRGLNTGAAAWTRHHDASHHANLDTLAAVAARIRPVLIENRTAARILEWTADKPQCVIYVDPPYEGADTRAYETGDTADLSEILAAQPGRVAVSGYGDTWDHLDWQRQELTTLRHFSVNAHSRTERTEVLWTNYQPDRPADLFTPGANA